MCERFSSVISDTLNYRPSPLRQKPSQGLFKTISNTVAHKLLRCRSDPSTIPLRDLYALLDSPLPLFPQHDFRRVPTQPELHGER